MAGTHPPPRSKTMFQKIGKYSHDFEIQNHFLKLDLKTTNYKINIHIIYYTRIKNLGWQVSSTCLVGMGSIPNTKILKHPELFSLGDTTEESEMIKHVLGEVSVIHITERHWYPECRTIAHQ
jgi:hypothetical protein